MKIVNRIAMILLAVGVVAFATTSCTEQEPYVPEWEWDEPEEPRTSPMIPQMTLRTTPRTTLWSPLS
jgi:hypothetical protein